MLGCAIAVVSLLLAQAPEPRRPDPVRIDARFTELVQGVLRDGVVTRQEQVALRQSGIPDVTVDAIVKLARGRFKPPPGGSYLDVPVRQPVTEHEVDMLAVFVRASDAQNALIQKYFAEYRERMADAWAADTAEMWQMSSAAARSEEGTPERVARFRELTHEADRVDQRLAQLDEGFFANVQAILADPQVRGLDRSRLLRQRMAHRASGEWYAGSNIDLSLLYFRWEESDAGELVAADARVDAVLVEYEVALTPLVVALVREGSAANVKRAANLVRLREIHGDTSEPSALLQERRAAATRCVEVGKRIHDLNVRTLEAMHPLLPEPASIALRESFFAGAYPVVHAVDAPPLHWMERVLADPQLDEALRAVLGAAHDHLSSDVDDVHTKMISEYIEWRKHTAEMGGYQPDAYGTYRRSMLALLKVHHDALVQSTTYLAELMPERRTELEVMLAQMDQRYRERNAPNSGRGLGWPDPSDDFDLPKRAVP